MATKPKYTKLDSNLNPLPDDSTVEHEAVRVEHPLLAKPLIVAARRCDGSHAFKKAQEAAAKHTIYGQPCRAMTVEEAFFVADRTNSNERLDKSFFPDAEGYEFTWTSDVDASSPAGVAWGVALGYGHCNRNLQGYRNGVRAVLAGQS